jgi:hypothetical protein
LSDLKGQGDGIKAAALFCCSDAIRPTSTRESAAMKPPSAAAVVATATATADDRGLAVDREAAEVVGLGATGVAGASGVAGVTRVAAAAVAAAAAAVVVVAAAAVVVLGLGGG